MLRQAQHERNRSFIFKDFSARAELVEALFASLSTFATEGDMSERERIRLTSFSHGAG
jgi:hypothetical protein